MPTCENTLQFTLVTKYPLKFQFFLETIVLPSFLFFEYFNII